MNIWIFGYLPLPFSVCFTAEAIAPEMALTLPTKELSPTESKAFDELKKVVSYNALHDSPARSTYSRCLPGTRKEQIECITNWIKMGNEKKPLFLVLGPAGSGKTSLLDTIAQVCKDKGQYAAGFFFSDTDANQSNYPRLVTTIAYQIAETIPELRPYIARIIDMEPSILERSLESQTKALLLEPLRQLRCDHPNFWFHPRVAIIDALDECGKSKDQSRVLAALAEALSNQNFPFICLLSSRFNTEIEHEMSTTLMARIHDRVILGKNGNAEKADIQAYLCANVERIRVKHPFGKRIPEGWPTASDLETIVEKSSGQFIYASTVIRYIESPKHNPHIRLQHVLGISSPKLGEGPFAELDGLYRALMSSVGNLSDAIEIMGIHLVELSSKFWTPATVKSKFDFKEHFCSRDADIVLAPLASVLKYEDGGIQFYHLSFTEFLLDHTRSDAYFVDLEKCQKWIVSRFVPVLYDCLSDGGRYPFALRSYGTRDVEYLIKEGKPGTCLHQAINEGLTLVANHPKLLPSGGDFNIWPFVTYAFFEQLQHELSIEVCLRFMDRTRS